MSVKLNKSDQITQVMFSWCWASSAEWTTVSLTLRNEQQKSLNSCRNGAGLSSLLFLIKKWAPQQNNTTNLSSETMWLILHLKCCRNTQSATRHHQSVPSQPGNYYPWWTDLFQLKCCSHSEALSAPFGGRVTSLGGPVWSLTLPPTDPTWVWNEGRSQSRGRRGQKNKI